MNNQLQEPIYEFPKDIQEAIIAFKNELDSNYDKATDSLCYLRGLMLDRRFHNLIRRFLQDSKLVAPDHEINLELVRTILFDCDVRNIYSITYDASSENYLIQCCDGDVIILSSSSLLNGDTESFDIKITRRKVIGNWLNKGTIFNSINGILSPNSCPIRENLYWKQLTDDEDEATIPGYIILQRKLYFYVLQRAEEIFFRITNMGNNQMSDASLASLAKDPVSRSFSGTQEL